MIDPSFLEQLKELKFVIKSRISTVYSGGRPSIRHGKGIEVVDYREYMPGDDFRTIDWRVYGRTEKLYIRRFEEEKDLILHILLDSSASMDFQTVGINKFDYAGSIAAGFGFLAIHNQEKFATALYAETIREVTEPKKSKAHLFKVIDMLNTVELKGETNLGVCAGQYAKMIKSKAFCIIISDFIEPLDSIKEGLYRMAKHSKELMLIQVLDPWELNLGWRDDVKFEDVETGETKRTFLSPTFKKEYHERLAQHIYAVQEACYDVGVEFHSVTTDKPLFDTFVKLVGGGRHRG